ncbi:hypothetical protein [Haloferax chudinovii]|uniref:Uncharacterized protein n=1 Tax=Haloferax chudinovii TaxID=1109010 RepID=A0ABD5XMM0_9EURY
MRTRRDSNGTERDTDRQLAETGTANESVHLSSLFPGSSRNVSRPSSPVSTAEWRGSENGLPHR